MDITHYPHYNLPDAELPADLKPEDSYQGLWKYSKWDLFSSNTDGGNSFDETWPYPDPTFIYPPYHGIENHSSQHDGKAQADDANTITDLEIAPSQQSIKVIPGDQASQATAVSKRSHRKRSKRGRKSDSPKDSRTLHNSPAQRPGQGSSMIVATASSSSFTQHSISTNEEVEVDTDTTSPSTDNSPTFKPKSRDKDALKRNRIAARKCRKRKQAENTTLASKELEVEHLNTNLKQYAKGLVEEVRCLKMMLLDHAKCDSQLIQDYIKKEAECFVEKTKKAAVCAPELSPGSSSVSESAVSLRSLEYINDG